MIDGWPGNLGANVSSWSDKSDKGRQNREEMGDAFT